MYRLGDDLTPRDFDVLRLLQHGLSNHQIGMRLGLSVAGVKYHLQQIAAKLGTNTRTEAVAVALHHRIIEFTPEEK